jgi:hypothetical protein
MQRTQFRAKSANNDLKPTDFLKCNFYFEIEGVVDYQKMDKIRQSSFQQRAGKPEVKRKMGFALVMMPIACQAICIEMDYA